jgi:hypothetical protein
MNTGILLEPFNWTFELKSYQKLLEESASSESKWPVFNDGKEHAAILMSVIFKNAKDYVYLYSRALSTDLSRFDIYYESLNDCINRGVDIKLLLQSQNAFSVDNPSIELIKNKKSENVKILTIEQSEVLKQRLNDMDIHFAVSDGKRYRLEYDIRDRKATSSFNDPSVANVLKGAFDAAFGY